MARAERQRLPAGLFVTGTDTGIGKTVFSCALLHALAATGLTVVGMKPVAAGATRWRGAWVNDDVEALHAAGNVEAPATLRNPYVFAPPIAPHIAAREAGASISLPRIRRAFDALQRRADIVVVEGAGGFRVPLDRHRDFSDLAVLLRLPVILVVGMRLGCINHALLTAAAVRASGLGLAGWVANHVDRSMARQDENVCAIAQRIGAPLVARLPFRSAPAPRRLAARIDLHKLTTRP